MTQYFENAPQPTEKQIAKIAELKASAADARRREQESFERCDTDGFLSQWALTMTARKNDAEVKLLEHGGCAAFPVLVFNGEVIATKIYEFADTFRPDHWNAPMQQKWRIPDELVSVIGRKWVPVGGKSRVQKQLGLEEQTRWFPARAVIASRGKATGLSGAASVYIAIEKVEQP